MTKIGKLNDPRSIAFTQKKIFPFDSIHMKQKWQISKMIVLYNMKPIALKFKG